MFGAVVDRLEQEQGRRHPKRAGWIVTGHLNLMMPGGLSRRLLEVRVALGESLGQCVESRERVLRKRLGPFCMQEPRRVPDLGVRDAEIRAHAEFRKTLYSHDVVPEAQALALSLA